MPVSGDGTLRKNPTIWRQWNPSVGQSLHKCVNGYILVFFYVIDDVIAIVMQSRGNI